MSGKDGIPLLVSFEDDLDDSDHEDFDVTNVRPLSGRYPKWLSKKKTIIFSIALGLSLVLVIGVIVGITVPLLSARHGADDVILVGPVSSESCTKDSVVCPSKLDDRQYRVTTLNNGLRVLLISDPNSNISAAAMDIPAGSVNDPPDYEGLAHFCEHMLFIGTKKYPETNQYSSFLQTHGGSDNAYTSTQNTNYFFSVQAEYFSTALDMFAHFFIDPLFSVGSVMDEMNAVNAEHQKNLHTDGWKVWQLLKNVSNPLHPLSQFSTGSLETLNKSGVHKQLLQYFNSSYSANTVRGLMCVYSTACTTCRCSTECLSACTSTHVVCRLSCPSLP